MKTTMNSRDIAKYHKFLKAEMPVKRIGKLLGVDEKTLKKFAPDALALVKKKQAEGNKPKAPVVVK